MENETPLDGIDFHTPETFELEVERYRQKHNSSYLDSIVDLLEQEGIELDDAGEYISPLLKLKLENEILKTRQLKVRKFQSDFEGMFS